MRIQRLDKNTKKNLLEDLLKRSPNHYGTYEKDVAEILGRVKRKGMLRCLNTPDDLTVQTRMRPISG